ncbi:MAG: hypothetical protein HY549_07890 [Elusimicrobia bacterium]|nr:hypothetical protein [Elusimicrobiota bacterium]
MDDLHLRQLTKELVAEKLRSLPDPCATTAELVRKTLLLALKDADLATQERLAQETCQGAITALLLAQQNLSRGAVKLLEQVADVANDLQLEPAVLMIGAMRGIADLRRFVPPEELFELRKALEARFIGVGEVFATILLQQEKANPTPPSSTANPKT